MAAQAPTPGRVAITSVVIARVAFTRWASALLAGLSLLCTAAPATPEGAAPAAPGGAARPTTAAIAVDELGPIEVPSDGYVSSAVCRGCHPSNYESWHHSYHRRMTQRIGPDVVRAPWHGVELERGGQVFRLEEDEDGYWVDLAVREDEGQTIRERRPVVMTTGSHHMQLFWDLDRADA